MVYVRGLKKHSLTLEKIKEALEIFINKEIHKNIEPTIVKISSKCNDDMKTHFNVADKIKNLQSKYPNIIKSFDISKNDIIEVEYVKIETQNGSVHNRENPGWEQVRNKVEGIIPYSVALNLNKENLAKDKDIEDEVVSLF